MHTLAYNLHVYVLVNGLLGGWSSPTHGQWWHLPVCKKTVVRRFVTPHSCYWN